MNFDTIIDRRNTYCDKWDYLEHYYGEKDMLGLWVADMDFAVPEVVNQAIKKRTQHPIYGYTETDESYYDAMIEWYRKRQDYPIEREWISYAPGVIPAICFLISAFTEEGDKIIIQEPVYHPFKNSILNNDRVPLINELIFDGEQYRMDLDSLEAQIDEKTKMMLLCSPHNPVGRVWTREELTAVGELCMRHNILLVSDEIHGDIVYSGHKHIPFATLSEEFADHCVVCNAPNKTFNIAGLQGGNVIIRNPEIREKYRKFVSRFHLAEFTPFSMTAHQTAYRYGEEWLEQLLVYLEENIRFTSEYIKAHLPCVKMIQPEATYMVWLDFNGTGLSAEEINDRLIKKAKVAFNDGGMFGRSGAGFQRMNVACPREIIEMALHRVTDAFIDCAAPLSSRYRNNTGSEG